MCHRQHLRTLSADAARKLNVLGHDGHALGMNSAHVRVLKESYEVGLRGFLESEDRGRMESKVSLEVLSDLTDKALEGELADEQVSALLVLANLAKCHGSRAAVGLLHAPGRGRGFALALVASCLQGALPPVLLRAVCLVRAMVSFCGSGGQREKKVSFAFAVGVVGRERTSPTARHPHRAAQKNRRRGDAGKRQPRGGVGGGGRRPVQERGGG